MEELYEILEDIIPGEDYKNSTALVDDDILTSFELVRLVTEIDSTFDISIPSSEIVPDNFNSAETIWAEPADHGSCIVRVWIFLCSPPASVLHSPRAVPVADPFSGQRPVLRLCRPFVDPLSCGFFGLCLVSGA